MVQALPGQPEGPREETVVGYEYTFAVGVGLKDAEETLLLAFLAATGLFGRARVLGDVRYGRNDVQRTLKVGAETAVGSAINAIFIAFIRQEFGEDRFTVRPLKGPRTTASPAPLN